MEYASRALAGTALGTGIGGLALGAVNSGLLPNLFGANRTACGDDAAVNRYELSMTQQMANKDMEIVYWRGQDETNRKISDAYGKLEAQINNLACEVQHNKDEQNGINLQQAVYNGTNTAAIGCIQGQIAQLFSLTKLIVPNGSVCPGWGSVTITPAAAPTGG